MACLRYPMTSMLQINLNFHVCVFLLGLCICHRNLSSKVIVSQPVLIKS